MSNPMRLMSTIIAVFVLALGASFSAWAEDKPSSKPQAPPKLPAPAAPKPVIVPVIPDFTTPKKVTLCGETFPVHIQDVYERLDMEFTIAVHSRAQVYLWLRRAGRYFPHIEKRLKQSRMPDDLKYLAVAESDLRPYAVSPARAVGTWQFIPWTGKRFGLAKDKQFDERRSFERSTEAAIRFLKRLKAMFGKWTLAMAAYNCGEGCVAKAVKEQQVSDYFRLNLPRETERYVYRIAAIKMILENPWKYGYRFQAKHAYKPLRRDKIQVDLKDEVHLTDAAKAIGTEFKVLKELNPQIIGPVLPKGRYSIWTPAGKGRRLASYLKQAAARPDRKAKSPRYYVVRRGDTLNRIAYRTGVPVDRIRALNRLRGSHIWPGQRLRLSR